MRRKNFSEYLEIQRALRVMQIELQREDAEQKNLREQIAISHNMLKEMFSRRWPPLREREIE
ncbi:hypothetical protein VZO05_07825 [Aggregatilineales bacterium SYSU G02658]